MTRFAIAVPAGLLGMALYVMAVVVLADQVLAMHWAVQAVYFLAVGTLWALPAHHLILWAYHKK